MKLSERLQAVCNLTSGGNCVADIGTDHAYLPMELIRQGKYHLAIAMDINEGPLERAREHIEKEKLQERIQTRLSDGLEALEPGECSSVVIAGMGGALTIQILEHGKELRDTISEWILQPQSELYKVRQYLLENGYIICREDMVFEDGKFYPMFQVRKGVDQPYTEMELLYGRHLLREKHPILVAYLLKEIKTKEQIIMKLQEQKQNPERVQELQREIMLARAAYLTCM